MASPLIKRKRDDAPSSSTVPPSIQLPIHISSEATPRFTFYAPTPLLETGSQPPAGAIKGDADGGSSPRTRVASRFGSLAIEEHVHKRMRSEPEPEPESEPTPERSEGDARNPRDTPDTRDISTGEPAADHPNESIYAQLTTAASATAIDPLRASLTWQDDEITVYDPNDKDDDGTGVNGIGFKPTPAIAHARALKRRQQLAEYRKREEREARARRSRRRPRVYTTRRKAKPEAGSGGAAETVGAEPAEGDSTQMTPSPLDDDSETPRPRRVRFLETGPVTIRFLEPEVAV